MRRLLVLSAFAIACGGSTPRSGEARDDSGALVERAAAAWGELDPENAARLAERAIAISPTEDAREIAARSHLALGRYERAERALEGADDAELLRLRARAQIASDRYAEAVLTLEAAERHTRD